MDRIEQLLRLLPTAAYLCDPEGLLTHYNEAAVRLWGRRPALLDPDERWCGSVGLYDLEGRALPRERSWMAQAVRERRPYLGRPVLVERADGSRRRVLANASPVFGEDGRLSGALNLLMDLSESESLRNQAEAMLRGVLDLAREGVVVEDADGTVLHANPAAEALLGQHPAGLVGLNFIDDLLVPEQRALARANLGKVLRGEGLAAGILDRPVRRRYLRHDGRVLDAEVVFSRMPGDGGSPGRVAAFFTDAGLRGRLEALQKGLYESNRDGMFTVGLDGTLLEANEAALKLGGYTREEALGRNLKELFLPRGRWNGFDEIRRSLRATGAHPALNRRLHREFRRKDGSRFPGEVYLVPALDGDPPMLLGFVRDRSLEQAELDVATRARRFYETIVRHSVDLMGVFSPEGETLFISDSVRRWLGWDPAELQGRDAWRLYPEEERARGRANLARLLRGEATELTRDVRLLKADGGTRPMRVNVRVLGPESPVQGTLMQARDLEGELEAQHKLLQYQRLAVFGQLASGFAHEVRNPLAGILIAAQLAQRRLQGGGDAAEQLQVILRQGERLKNLMDDLLQQARAPREQARLLDPCDTVRRAVESARQQFGRPGAVVTVDCPRGPATRVVATEERLQRLVHNLVLNALQALPDGGGSVAIRVRREGADLKIRIEDDGCGLPSGSEERVFEPFFTTKPTGSGLGLWIAESLAREMGGRLAAEGLRPHGSAFTLTLPAAEGN